MSNPNKVTVASQKMVTGMIADSSGHSDFLGTLDDAVKTIMDGVNTAGKWVYVNGNPFMFDNPKDEAEHARLRNRLAAEDKPEFVLTGSLQGGAE